MLPLTVHFNTHGTTSLDRHYYYRTVALKPPPPPPPPLPPPPPPPPPAINEESLLYAHMAIQDVLLKVMHADRPGVFRFLRCLYPRRGDGMDQPTPKTNYYLSNKLHSVTYS